MSEEMKMSDYFNLPIEQGDVLRINQYCTVEHNNDGVAPFDAAVVAINNHDRLVEENARLTELVTQKASRADELFGLIESMQDLICSYKDNADLTIDFGDGDIQTCLTHGDVESLEQDVADLVNKIKQESSDE